jgi:PAS domain S-box-containing protein
VEEGQLQRPVHLKLGQGLTSYLVTTGRPILLTHGVEGFIEEHGLTLEGSPARSWLGVPMIAEGRVIGAMAVQSYERDNAFDEDHLALLTTIGGQAAVAFQNASLFEERERRIGELAVLNEMAQAISSALEMDALLALVYRQISLLVDTRNFQIALYDEDRDEVTFPFVVDPEQREDWRPRHKGTGPIGRIIDTGEPLLLPTGVAGLHEAGQREPDDLSRCWLGVPMVAEDKVLGVIAVQSYDQEYLYDAEDLRLLSTVAAQAAVAVRNAQLYQQIVGFSADLEQRVEERTRELEQAALELTTERDRATTLYRIASELGTTLDLERVLHRALRLFADTLGVEHGSILLLDQESGRLVLNAVLEEDQRLPREGLPTPLKRGVGLAGWVLENREPVLVPDITKDLRWVDIPERRVDARSVVVAPLSLGGGDILGVLTLGHPEVGHFNEDHLHLVTAAAAQVAVAVSNSDLYAFITDQADQLGATLQAMQAEADKSRAILESIADGVLVLDHKGRVLLVNPAAEEMLGISAMVLEGDHFRHMLGLGEEVVHRDLAQGLYSELRRWLEATEEDAAQLQAGAVRLESGNRVLAVNVAPLLTTIGQTPGLVAALRDISREAEVERLKNEFISTVSHELRTPMTSIKGYTDLLFLGMAGGLSDAQRNFLQIIKSNADRLTALVNDILDISRIETGRLRLTIEPLDLGELIDQTTTSFQEQYREKGLTLEWEEPEKLPQVRGDAARVTQVLSNLIANAWQYTPSGGHVLVTVYEKDGFLQVDVADTGIGIGPDDIARVFDRFYRADRSAVREAEGTGLGLSIVKMFVEMLGGEIWIESELDVGSTFSFTLPLFTAETFAETAVQPDLLMTDVPAAVRRRPKILVVESNHDLALSLRRQLEMGGYQVLLAGSGEDALWLAQEEQPRLIALDIMLPDLDGFVVLERLKEHPATAPIPVVIISVLSETDRGYALGAVDYVVKPFDEGKLLQSIRLALAAVDGGEQQDLLVVDDDPDILHLLDHALSYHGYQVRTAADGQGALDQIGERPPDLILLDLKMPQMDGYEVIRRLKVDEETRPIPIIVITASPVDKERDKVQVLGMGASQYITKPLSIETLVHEIEAVIQERQQE